ncbi:hypothetical protein FGO68_gene6876 [Halteria grandinella]|uniref:Uncharacterized protein n=1 Tax=Halteria grandinella TaxID=5974 RepID=A0A8J8SUN9_HALGN|nr:hypothetical protein FGO68_gene6876 [Halteria grandinella]
MQHTLIKRSLSFRLLGIGSSLTSKKSIFRGKLSSGQRRSVTPFIYFQDLKAFNQYCSYQCAIFVMPYIQIKNHLFFGEQPTGLLTPVKLGS